MADFNELRLDREIHTMSVKQMLLAIARACEEEANSTVEMPRISRKWRATASALRIASIDQAVEAVSQGRLVVIEPPATSPH